METVNIKINNKNYEYPKNVALDIIAKDLSNEYKGIVTIGKIKNKLKDLNSTLDKNCDLELIDTTQPDGMRVYMRTLSLIFIKACEEIFNGCKVTIEHSLSNGLYCEIKNNKSEVTEEDIEKIKAKVKSIIESDLKIEKIVTDKSEAIKILKNNNKNAKAELLKYKEYEDVKLYKCGGYINHFYGHMLPSTSYVKTFDIKKWQSGVVILGPSKENKNEPQNFVAQPKLSNIYKESEVWSELIGIDKVASLNEAIESKKYGEIISIVEALHEKKISQIADIIKENNKRVILIAAPSSSGKTSFAHRLSIQLKVNNLHPVPISLDDYFVDREDTPLDEFGNFDFESIYAIDLELFTVI